MKANESNRTERQQRVNVVGHIFVEVGNFWEFQHISTPSITTGKVQRPMLVAAEEPQL